MYLKYNREKDIDFDKRIELKYPPKNFYSFDNKNKKIILGGTFYYYNSTNLKSICFNNNPEKQLLVLIKKYNLEDFINNVEGEYWGVEIDYKKQSLTVFSDKLKQLELYYFYNENIFLVSDDLNEIIDKVGILGYEKNSLISAILFYVPKGQLFFKGIKRLKYNETIKLIQDKILIENFKDKNVEISNYLEKDLLKYNKIIRNAILSRASKGLNLVLISGGWDSTMILAILREHFEKNKVRGIILKIIMSDGRCFNKFEVEKAKDIGKALGVKIDVVEVDYRKKETQRRFQKAAESIFLQNLFFLAPANWYSLISHIKNKYGKDAVVFQGEGADSLHNYGFSQYISLPHDNDNFLEYADKMKNYLFSPTFFKKIKNSTFLNDAVYRIFRYFNQDKEFVDVKNSSKEERIYYYLLSFILSDARIPFRKVNCSRFVKDAVFQNFESWLKKEYFQEAVENINENNLYYYFSYLYILFHLQSPPIRIYRTGSNNMRFPYIDLNLFRFLYKMPEDFGRGLELNTTKFPLKKLAKKILSKRVFEILESGPYSYLSEVEAMNIWDEYFLKGPVYEYIRDTIDYRKCKDIFNDSTFNVNEIENFIKKFKQGKIKNISQNDARFLLILILLSSNPPYITIFSKQLK